jgi:hypothetical protein
MAMNPENTSSAQGGSFDKALNEDLKGIQKTPNLWTQARNAVNNTITGDLGELSNEASNYLSALAPYTVIGAIHLTADEWAIFSTDDTDSEIGIFKEDAGTYTTTVNAQCLAFKRDHLIKGVSKSSFDCSYHVYWDDGINPSRFLNIGDVPWIQNCQVVNDCQICTDTTDLDCEKIRLAPLVDKLKFRVNAGESTGELLNGSYYVVGAYLINGQRVTDYSLPSNVQGVFTHLNLQNSLDIIVEYADDMFDEFELVIVQFANYNTVAKRFGTYSTKQGKITIDQISETLPAVNIEDLRINNPIADSSDATYRNGDYLIRSGPKDKFDFNYQPLANQIVSKWVSVEYDEEYYRNGGHNVGHMRDEVYPYFIRWVFNTGDHSASYHIPGRYKVASDDTVVATDVLSGETDARRWKIYNTAVSNPAFNQIGNILPDGGEVIGGGDMAYWESSEIYPDKNPEVWNASSNAIWGSSSPAHDLCGKPIRHHKFPDNATDVTANMVTNHYNPNSSDAKIRVMGIQFRNIQAPLDNNGNPLTNVVGYEILRGSREGNRTVFAKGIINNMRGYVTETPGETRDFLYPNYPYNPTTTWDKFLSSKPTKHSGSLSTQFNQYLGNGGDIINRGDIPLGADATLFPNNKYLSGTNVKQNILTFHSAENNFRDPFLSSKELKIYGEVNGTVRGEFTLPKDHPRHKFVTDTAFLVSAFIGLGYAIVGTEGVKTVQHSSPTIDYGGTYAQVGVSTGTTGLFGPSAVAAAAMSASAGSSTAADKVQDNLLSQSVLSVLQSSIGIDSSIALDSALITSGTIAGSVGGAGSTETTSREVSPWAATPDILRVIQGLPSFLTFWGEGINTMLDIIYAFTPYKQFALQYVSHCFYDEFQSPIVGNIRKRINFQSYLDPGLQDFTLDYRINNIYRSRSVAMEIDGNLDVTKEEDTSQVTFSEQWGRSSDIRWAEEYVNTPFLTRAASHYAAIKQPLDNQYGQLDSINQIPISCGTETGGRSDILFNGDTYIGRYTEKNTMFFFYDWLKGQPDGAEYDWLKGQPDGAEYDYQTRKMVVHPRFWMNTDPFDISEFTSSLRTIFQGNGPPPEDFDPFLQEIPDTESVDPDTGLVIKTTEKPCNCDTVSDSDENCKFNQGDLEDLCDCYEQLAQDILYIEFLEDCLDYEDTFSDSDYEGANVPSGTIPDPVGLSKYVGQSCCDTCPGKSDKKAQKYNEDDKGPWRRIFKRADKQVGRTQKKCDKIKGDIYEDYLSELTGRDNTSFISKITSNIITPNDKYAFDLKGSLRFSLRVKNGYMYLFNSGVRDFFIESEINIDYRDWGEPEEERHFDHLKYTDLRQIFSTDHIKRGNFYKYDYSLSVSKLFNNYLSWGNIQPRDYDPFDAERCFLYRPKRLIYSLPQNLENKKDFWRTFLPQNYRDFKSEVSAIKPIGKTGAVILFQNESPIQFVGRDTLQTDGGTKITIGDGGLFSGQALQNLVNAEDPHEYGSCQNRLSVINTPAGMYYISQNQGKIFQITGDGITEVSNQGLKWWFVKYLPYKLTNDFPDFELVDNPVTGIGCQSVFDNENQVVFFSKKDYTLRTDIADVVTYIGGNLFSVNGALTVELGNPAYFNDASWTISYDPKSQGFISYHDWHPDLVIPSKKTFMTTKGRGLWVHADRCDNYCNFYGIDYPFEVEFSLHTQADVNTLRNIMYFMEVYQYADNCDDRFHVLDFNFDESVVYNSEQCSGLLRMNLTPKNNPLERVNYPLINTGSIDILYSKEEQKYRFNQFFDITDDRGEFNAAAQRTIFNTEPNGYVRNLNAANLNYNKFALERKKFRHYKNTVLLRRTISGNKNMIISLAVQMNLKSSR